MVISLASAPCGAHSTSTSNIIMLSGITRGKGNVLLFPRDTDTRRERLGGLLRYYHQEAA